LYFSYNVQLSLQQQINSLSVELLKENELQVVEIEAPRLSVIPCERGGGLMEEHIVLWKISIFKNLEMACFVYSEVVQLPVFMSSRPVCL